MTSALRMDTNDEVDEVFALCDILAEIPDDCRRAFAEDIRQVDGEDISFEDTIPLVEALVCRQILPEDA